MTIDGIIKYLDETGLNKKIDNLEPGQAFGIEIPVDDNGKFLHFWLTMTTIDDEKYATIDFDDVIRIRVCCNEKKLEDWMLNSGIMEFGELQMSTETEQEKVTE